MCVYAPGVTGKVLAVHDPVAPVEDVYAVVPDAKYQNSPPTLKGGLVAFAGNVCAELHVAPLSDDVKHVDVV